MSLEVGVRFGRFELLEKLGAGGMGEVFRAHDSQLGRDVAVKFLADRFSGDRERLTRFAQEARAASALNHPNIVTVHEIGELAGRPYLVLELIEGATLRDLLASQRRLPVRRVLDLSVQLADGLSAAHAAGIVHRDLKPENLMVRHDGLVKILDFGLAKLRESDRAPGSPDLSTLDPSTGGGVTTLAGVVLGTVGYMSPEQARGAALDSRSDQFALGAILYELATGRRAFERGSAAETLAAVLDHEPEPLASVAPEFPAPARWIVERCLAKDPAGRYDSTIDLARELRAVRDHLGEMTPSSPPSGVPIAGVRTAVARRSFWAAAVLVALALPLALPSVRAGLARRLLGSAPLPLEKRVAVLPLEIESGGPEDRLRADGLVEALTERLSQLGAGDPSLTVVPAADVRSARVLDAQTAREALGATLVLSGSLRRQDRGYRLAATLIDTGQGSPLRALEPRDYRFDDATLAEKFAGAAARMLELEVGRRGRGGGAAGVPRSGEIWSLYLEARGHLQRFDRVEELEQAISLLQQVVARDPSYALGFAALGEAHWRLYELTKRTELVELARQNCRRALAIDDLQAPVYVTLGMISRGTGQTEAALDSFARALDRDPRNADALREQGRALADAGRAEEAERAYRRALALRPSDWAAYNYLGALKVAEGRFEEAAEAFARVTRLAPDNVRGYTNLGVISYKLGRLEDAAATLRRSVAIRPTAIALTNLGTTLFYLGRFEEAEDAFQRAVELDERNATAWLNLGRARHVARPGSTAERQALARARELAEAELSVNPHDAAVLADLADLHAMLGERRRAREFVERALADAEGDPDVLAVAASVFKSLGDRQRALHELREALAAGYPRWEIERSPDLTDLRADPGFQQLQLGT